MDRYVCESCPAIKIDAEMVLETIAHYFRQPLWTLTRRGGEAGEKGGGGEMVRLYLFM